MMEGSTRSLLRLPSASWTSRLLLAGFVLELVNLFSIAVTEGFLRLPPFSLGRFASFSLHAVLAWIFLAARQLLRHRDADQKRRFSVGAELIIVALCLLGARLYFQYGVRLSADAPHYFVQIRSLMFDHDLDFTNDYENVRPRIPIAGRYPVGLPLLSFPFLAAAHLLVLLARWAGHDLPANGFGYPYETAFELSGYVCASIALLVLLRVLRRWFSTGLATISLVTAAASSFLVWYMVIEPGMPHAMSFAWASFFLGFWLTRRPLRERRDFVVLGVLLGIASLVRWQNVMLVCLPLVDQLLDSPRSLRRVIPMLLASGIVFVPQLIFWRATAGSLVALPTAGHDVSWEQMSVLEVLYSTNRGLFPWNPALYLGTLGLLLWLRQSPRLAALFLLGFLLEVYVNSSVGIWWAGWSFGGRRFDGCFLFFVVGLAVAFDFLRRRPMISVAAASGALFLWNLGLMQQTRRGLVPPDRLVSFRDVTERTVEGLYDRFGLPFAAPANWLFAARYGVTPEKFDRLFGHEGFGNFRLTFDAESTPYVGRGWGEPERGSGGEWYRWSIGKESILLVPLKQPRDYELQLHVRPFAEAAPNVVGLAVNGKPEPARPLQDASILRWVLRSDVFREGINLIRFSYQQTARPSRSSDSRELAVAFYRLELVAVPD